jgi:TP901-1 family phage major tail protein
MAKMPGYMGGIYTNDGSAVKIAQVRDATLSIEASEIDVTSFDSNGWVENIAGLKSWSVDAEALFDPADASQQDVYDALVEGTALSIQLFPKDAASQKGYAGTVIVTSFEVGVPLDDAVTVSLTLTGSGALESVTKGA